MKLTRQTIIENLRNPKSSWQTAILVTITAAAYLIRAHPYIFKPQLYAEDGVLWLAEGYQKNILAVFQPDNGFLHFPERLFGFLVAHISLQFAPLIFVLTAWGLFILITYYLVTPRTKILAHNYERVFLVLSLCLIANFHEFFFNFSNSIFLMGIIGALMITAKQSRYKAVDIAEKTFFVLSSLTLPFAWFYLPIALFERYKYKKKDMFYLYVSVIASITQVVYFILSHVNRSPVTLFSLISKYALLEIYNQMLMPAVRFARMDIPVQDFSEHRYPVYLVFLCMIALAMATYVVVRKSNRQVNYLLFFLGAMTFASLKSPTINVPTALDAIKTMSVVLDGNRYFIYGILAINLVFVKTAYRAFAPQARYIFMIVFLAFGLITSMHYQVFLIDKHFTDYTTEYNQGIKKFNSGKEKTVTIRVNPNPWTMTLTHK